MHKSLALLALLAASVLAQGDYHMDVTNDAGRTRRFWEYKGHRSCFCLKNTQTNKIKNINVGDAKLFWSNNCEGSYVPLARGATSSGAHWVNSFSFGDSGRPSVIADSTCPKYL
ncbi:hypothetical protein BG004_000281 [Podila humilis]|nr:hypothetical protein BG004_000281 [Podila humilis]